MWIKLVKVSRSILVVLHSKGNVGVCGCVAIEHTDIEKKKSSSGSTMMIGFSN